MCTQKLKEWKYFQLGKDFSREDMIKKFPTARTFPQIIIDGHEIGGYDQLKEKLG